MRKILALMLTVIMIVGIFALPVMAEESVQVLNENFGKVKIQGKVQSNNSVAFAVRSSFGDSETKDIVQYFISPRGDEDTYGMEKNQAFDFDSGQELVEKTSSTVFGSGTKGGGDERTPVSLSGFGWIGAGHGMTCAVTVIGEHDLTYKNIGDRYLDINNREWVLLRVSKVKEGDVMTPALVFISKELLKGDATNPTFHSFAEDKNRGYAALDGTELVNVENSNNKVTVNKYKNSAWLRPAYNMTKQDVYVVNDGEKTLVQANGSTLEGDYVLVEEEYTIMNPVYVAQAIIDGKPEGGYTENPNLAVGKPLVTFDLEYIYNADGTVISNWETTYHQDVTLGEFGGIQYGMKGDFVYLPGTKPFTMKSSVSLDGGKVEKDSVNFDFSNLFDTTTGYPNNGYATMDTWADVNNAPNRRLDFAKSNGVFSKAFAGGQLPVFDGEPSVRSQKTDRAFYFWNTRKAYHFSVGGSNSSAGINKMYPDMTGVTHKGSAYKTWIEDFDANGTSSFYSVPYFSDGDSSRYFYFDLYQPGVTKKYDISAYLGTYSISKLEQSANLEYSIDYETGILTVSSLENNQTSADYLVLKAKYVGESVPAVEMKMRALPTIYNESINDKLAEIAEMMETVGAPESDYAPELIEKYKSLLAQKEAYEQAIKDEAANADRVAGLNNRYEYVDMKFVYDLFATENDRNAANWKKDSTAAEPNSLAYKGFVSGMTAKYPSKSNVKAFYTEKIVENPAFSKDANQNDIFTIGAVPFKLGKIARNDGEVGANAWIGRTQYDPSLFDDQSKLPAFDASVHGTINTQTAKATYQINRDGISEVNILSSVNSYSGGIKFIDVNVKYAGETKAKTYKYVIGRAPESFAKSIWAIEKDKFEELASNPNYTPDMVKGTADGSSGWTYKVKDDDFYAVQKATKYYQLKNNAKDYPIVKLSTIMDVDLSKLSDRNPTSEIVFPVTSAEFVRSTDMENHYVHNVKIPVDSTKTIETVQLHSNIEHPDAYITESGGFFDRGEWNVSQGALRLKYDGKDTVTIDGKEYVIFIDLNRECQESSFFGMTLTNAVTWQDKIDALNAKIEALEVEKTTKTQLAEIKAEINDLLAQNSSIVYVKDFSEVARTKLDNIEEYLKTHFSEEERLSMLAERTYDYLDITPDYDGFATLAEITNYAILNKAVNTSLAYNAEVEVKDSTGATVTIRNKIPSIAADGKTPITGDEAYYSKGLPGKVTTKTPGYVYLMDDLIQPNGTKVVSYGYPVDASATPADIVTKNLTRTKDRSRTIKNPQLIQPMDADGYAIIKNGDTQHKIGPLKEGVVSHNIKTLYADSVIPVAKTGTRLDVVLNTTNVNASTSGFAHYVVTLNNKSWKGSTILTDNKDYKGAPVAGLQKMEIIYADNTKETKYLLSTQSATADYHSHYTDNALEFTFLYAPKYDENGNEIVYDGSSVGKADTKFRVLTEENAVADKLLTNGLTKLPDESAVKFENPNILMAQRGNVATGINNRQDACGSNYLSADIVSVPVHNKEISSIKFFRDVSAALNVATSIKLTDAPTIGIVPATIEGLSDQYVYYAYCGRLGDGTNLIAATLSTSKADLIEVANTEILNAEDAEKAEDAIVKYIDNLYLKYRDLSDEAKARYNELTDSKDTIRLAKDGTGYKTTMFVKDALEKAYTIILANYDADDNYISAQIVTGTTKDGTYYVQNFKEAPEGTAKVRAFLWKDFATLIPLAGNIGEL